MTIKNKIKITVETLYLAEESLVNKSYVFSYTITIKNTGSNPAQLLDRHWIITNANNEVEEVTGDGVIGQQPKIFPNESYQYTSYVVLKTDTGMMQGTYTMLNDEGESFKAQIPKFYLLATTTIH